MFVAAMFELCVLLWTQLYGCDMDTKGTHWTRGVRNWPEEKSLLKKHWTRSDEADNGTSDVKNIDTY